LRIKITLPANLAVRRQSAGSEVLYFGGVAGYVRASRLWGITLTGVSGSSLAFLPETDWAASVGGIAGVLDSASEILGSEVRLNISLSPTVGSGQKNLGGLVGIINRISQANFSLY
jgi:hypothetical protein